MFSVFLYFFRSDLIRLQLFRLWIALNAIFFSSLVNKRLRFQLNIPSINPFSNQIYRRIDGVLLSSSKYGKRQYELGIFLFWKMKLYFSTFVLGHFWKWNCLSLFVYCCCFRLFLFLLFFVTVLSLGCIASFWNRFIFFLFNYTSVPSVISMTSLSMSIVECLFLCKML